MAAEIVLRLTYGGMLNPEIHADTPEELHDYEEFYRELEPVLSALARITRDRGLAIREIKWTVEKICADFEQDGILPGD